MRSNLKWLAMCAGVAVGGLAMAQDAAPAAPEHEFQKAPSSDAIRDTWNYFYKAQGQGPVLGDAKLCTEVAKDGANKFECTAEIPAEGVKANTTVLVWQIYLVPQGDTEELQIQIKLGNQVRETKDVKVKGEGWKLAHLERRAPEQGGRLDHQHHLHRQGEERGEGPQVLQREGPVAPRAHGPARVKRGLRVG